MTYEEGFCGEDVPGDAGCCAICGRDDRLVVDHSHETGELRGWLCVGCNCALGHYEGQLTHGQARPAFDAYLARVA